MHIMVVLAPVLQVYFLIALYSYSTACEGTLKTEAADRFVPVPQKLKKMLLEKEGEPEEYVFHDLKGNPLSQASFKRMWCRLMADARCATVRDYDPHEEKNWDILKQVKPTLTPHFLRHNYVTLLYEAGVDPLIAMKIVGHTDYKTTANIYTHVRDEMLKKATVNMGEVFGSGEMGLQAGVMKAPSDLPKFTLFASLLIFP